MKEIHHWTETYKVTFSNPALCVVKFIIRKHIAWIQPLGHKSMSMELKFQKLMEGWTNRNSDYRQGTETSSFYRLSWMAQR